MNIAVKLKYFVPFDHLMGRTEILRVEEGLRIADIFPLLAKKYAGFAVPHLFDHIVILLNGRVCKMEGNISDGDEVSILTPVVGG